MMASIGVSPMSLERERSRAEGLRARNEERVGRYLNARVRLIGVDKQALDEQVRERDAAKQAERDAAAAEFAQEQRIQALLAQRDAEEAEIRRLEMERVRADRDAQRQDKDRRSAAERDYLRAPLVPAACGASALQVFSGEDAAKAQRVHAQKDQMRAWMEQQAADKAAREASAADAEARYHEYLMAVTAARGQMEEYEAAARADLRARTRDINLELAEEKAAREEAWRQLQAEADAKELAAREAALLEKKGHQYSATGALQKDKFRGLTPAQRQEILRENERLQGDAEARAHAAAQLEAAWALQDERVRIAVDKQAAERSAQSKAVTAQWHDDIAKQRAFKAQQAAREKADRFGAIEAGGLYDGFGKSCR